MSRSRTTPVERALLVLAIAGLAAAAAQSILLVRVLVRLAHPAAPAPAPAPTRPRWHAGIDDVSAVPAQDPHAPPTGPIRITHMPPQQPPEPAAVAG